MSEKSKDVMKHPGTFIEIIRVDNGYAIYDFNVKQHDLATDRKAVPLVVFNTKEGLCEWLLQNWEDAPYNRYAI